MFFLRSMIESVPSAFHLPMSPVCIQPSGSITSAVSLASLWYPANTLGPRVSTSPLLFSATEKFISGTSTSLTSANRMGGPTWPGRLSPYIPSVVCAQFSVMP
jgi:hypothetical protein